MKEIEDYINKNDWRLKENSNFNYSYPDFVSYLAGHDIANYYLKKLYPKEISDLHKQGFIHIHDMSHLCNYCLGADLLLLISNGIKTKDIICNPAKHFSSICGQLVNWLISLQLETAGAIAINDIDILLTPFTVNDHLSQKQIKQHLQELIFSINIPCRWGQTPFINMNLAFKCPKYLKNVPVIIGGKNQGYTYGEIKKDDLMDFQKAFLEVLIEQGKKGIPFTFPITTINFTRNFFNWELKELIYELVKTTGMPYFLNLCGSDLTGEESKSLCCRLNLNMKELYKNSGGRFGAGTSTGSNNVVDMNLPLIAQNKEDFWKSFDEILEQAMLCNIIKRKTIDGLFEQGLYPFLDKVIPNFKNFFLTISVQGGYDAFLMLKEKDYVQFAKKILERINKKILEYQKKTGYLFNVELAPGEGCSYRFTKHLKNFDKEYVTNGLALPVDFSDDIFDYIKVYDEIFPLYTGGSLFPIYLGEKLDNKAIESLLRLMSKTKIPYFCISPDFTICNKCDKISFGKKEKCSKCNSDDVDFISRVVGYYRRVSKWNVGKNAEFKDRKNLM